MSLLAKITQFPQVEAFSKKNPFFSIDRKLLQNDLLKTPSSWIQKQIKEELASFSRITSEALDQTEKKLKNQGISVYRFVIQGGRLLLPYWKQVLSVPRVFKMVLFLQQLLKEVDLPDMQFLYSPADHLPDFLDLEAPLFLISKTKQQNRFCLFPHVEWMNFWELTRKELKKQIQNIPWSKRKKQIFWRGATSGLGYKEGTNPRWQVVQLSQTHPEEVEAHFSSLVQSQNIQDPSQIQTKPLISPWQQATYRFLLALDGNCFPGSFQWQLGSGSLVIKQDSPYLEWYYAGLTPYAHYIPLQPEADDLLCLKQSISEELALQIIQNGQLFAEHYLSSEGICSYVVFLLRAYSQLLNLSQ